MVFDRTSIGLFVDELTALYEKYDSGDQDTDLSLPDLPIQYTDYTTWRIQHNLGEALAKPLEYWRERLKGMQPLELPTDRPRSKSVTTRGVQLFLDLPADTMTGISTIGRENGATLFVGLLAAFKLLLHQWTGSDDISVGTPFADRRLKGTKELLGFFVNHLILRTHVSDDSGFLDLLRSARDTCFGAYRHSSVPFDKLVEQLKPARQENRNPLFDVQFAFQKRHSQPETLGDVTVTPITPTRSTSQYDLIFTVREQADGYDLRAEYRTDLFDAESITRLMRRYRKLLQLIVSEPARKLPDFPLLTEDERTKIVGDWNATSLDYPSDKCVHQLFEEQARRSPNAIAVTSGDMSISYDDLDRRANQLAHHLIGLGLGPEGIAAICIERSVDMVVGLLGILKSGAAYLPLDRTYPDERLSYMLEDSGATVLVTQSAYLDHLPGTCASTVVLDGDAEAITAKNDAPPASRVSPENLAYVIYTSGSTGKPKGVQIEHRNVVNFLSSMQKRPGMSADDVLLAVTTLSFDIAVLEIYLPLITGARTVIASHDVAVDGNRMRKLMTDEQVTVMQATPVTWRLLIDAGWRGDKSFKVLCGGEAMPRDIAQGLVQRAGNVWNMYGPTETTVWSTCFPVSDGNGPLLIGRPIGNTGVYILDKYMRAVPVGRTGELYIGGDGVARGYLDRPELTNEKFVASPFDNDVSARLYATGDEARYLPDGNIEYLNRLDNQVKVRGNRIELGEIEAAVAACSEIRHAVVIVREDAPGDRRIAAYFVSEADHPIAGNDIRNRLRESLPPYMIPQYFIELDSLPLTPNGKVDRKALPAPDLDTRALADSFRAPRTKSEESLAVIWQDLLGLERVGIHDNFIELGGHSLLALRAISRIREDLGANITAMSMIMDTLEQIAAHFCDKRPVPDGGGSQDSQIGTVSPSYFGPGGSLLGLHHEPQHAAARSSAVLLCAPIYNEGTKAHWALKRLADQLARRGYHVLRFDYFGSGDSMGEGRDGNVMRWLEDIKAAADHLVALSGLKKLSVVGLRLGATLAAMSELEDVKDLVLWDPVYRGEDYMTYLQNRHESMIEGCNIHRSKPVSQGEDEILGFYCSSECRDMIQNTRISVLSEHSAERVIMVVPEVTKEQLIIEEEIRSGGKFVTRHVFEDARCEIDDAGRLTAFLPGASLRVIISELSEQDQ
jgi:amino acid adenylation domain-containing protein